MFCVVYVLFHWHIPRISFNSYPFIHEQINILNDFNIYVYNAINWSQVNETKERKKKRKNLKSYYIKYMYTKIVMYMYKLEIKRHSNVCVLRRTLWKFDKKQSPRHCNASLPSSPSCNDSLTSSTSRHLRIWPKLAISF